MKLAVKFEHCRLLMSGFAYNFTHLHYGMILTPGLQNFYIPK